MTDHSKHYCEPQLPIHPQMTHRPQPLLARTADNETLNRSECWRTLRCSYVAEMQTSAVLFSPLFCRDNFATKLSELNKVLLDCLQPFHPLSMSDLSIRSAQAVTPKLLIQVLYIGDLFSETCDLVPENQ